MIGRSPFRQALLVLAAFLAPACSSSDSATSPAADVERLAETVKAHPEDIAAQAELLAVLNGSGSAEICTADPDADGRVAALEAVDALRGRVPAATKETAGTGQGKAPMEALLDRVDSLCPQHKGETGFTRAMMRVAGFAEPLGELAQAVSSLAAPSGDAPPDLTALAGLAISVLSPDTPCAEGSLAMCGRDLSQAVEAMSPSFPNGVYDVENVVLTVGDESVDLSGRYNEATLRILAAAGEGVYGALLFAAAHVDISALLPEATPLLSGDFGFATAGQILATVDAADGLLLKVLEGAVTLSQGPTRLVESRDGLIRSLRWINGDEPGDAPAFIRALEHSTEEGLGLRFVDRNGDGRLNGCDHLEVNFAFARPYLEQYADLIRLASLATGCSGILPPNTVALPRMVSGGDIDYPALWSTLARALTKVELALSDPRIALGPADVNAFLSPLGLQALALPEVAEVHPGVVMESGLSFLAPASTGSGSSLRLLLEAEINADAAACPDAKSAKGEFVCRSKSGRQDWSASIARGDAEHFGAGADRIYVTEALLDENKIEANSFLRASRGGGILPYLKFKHVDLKGVLRVTEGLVADVTAGVPGGQADGVCLREIGAAPAGTLTGMDTRSANALINFAMVRMMACRTEHDMMSMAQTSGFPLGR
ncbi:MAG: hypothetical protein HYY13_08010 [Nitrospirae bacterium]|nr:hypothetical protein [Nitrospirota bacterium]